MNRAGVGVLVRRELLLLRRQPSRIAGAILQPLLFWLVLGVGLAGSFRPGGEGGEDYLAYFYPGVAVMMVLMTSIGATMSVIEDRHHGFLQGVLAAPGGRTAAAVGKSVGGAATGFLQAAILLLISPAAGYDLLSVNWPIALLGIGLSALAFTATGFLIAWRMDSTAGYHVIMSLILLPLWVLSGALFPTEGGHPAMEWAGRLNPMSYAVATVRAGLSAAPVKDALLPLAILAATAALALAAAARTARRPTT